MLAQPAQPNHHVSRKMMYLAIANAGCGLHSPMRGRAMVPGESLHASANFVEYLHFLEANHGNGEEGGAGAAEDGID